MNYATIILVSFTRHQFFLFQTINYAGQVAHRHHHLCSDFPKGKPAGISNGRKHVELRRRKAQLLEILLEFLVGGETKAEKSNPQARRVGGKKRTFENDHELHSIRRGSKKQSGFPLLPLADR